MKEKIYTLEKPFFILSVKNCDRKCRKIKVVDTITYEYKDNLLSSVHLSLITKEIEKLAKKYECDYVNLLHFYKIGKVWYFEIDLLKDITK